MFNTSPWIRQGELAGASAIKSMTESQCSLVTVLPSQLTLSQESCMLLYHEIAQGLFQWTCSSRTSLTAKCCVVAHASLVCSNFGLELTALSFTLVPVPLKECVQHSREPRRSR